MLNILIYENEWTRGKPIKEGDRHICNLIENSLNFYYKKHYRYDDIKEKLLSINNNEKIDDNTRKKEIKALLNSIGIDPLFIPYKLKHNNKESFDVYEDEWLRGEGSEKSFLLRPSDGKKCCLGFYAEQVFDATPKHISNVRTTVAAGIERPSWMYDIMKRNDNQILDDSIRKTELERLFLKDCNIKINFLPTNPNK